MAPRGKGPPSDGVLKAPEPQTDLDQTQITENAAVNSAENTPDSQTDPVLKVQPRKRVSARDILPSSGDSAPETNSADEPITRKRIKMEAPMPNTEILAIDDELHGSWFATNDITAVTAEDILNTSPEFAFEPQG